MLQSLANLLPRGVTHIQKGGLPFVIATLMSTLGLYGLLIFASAYLQLENIGDTLGQSVAAVAFLDVDGAAGAAEVQARAEALPGVAHVAGVNPEAVKARAITVLDGVPEGIEMPWALLVTPAPGADLAATTAALTAIAGVEEVMHPTGDVQRVQNVLNIVRYAGLFLFAVIGLLVIVLVANAVKITLYARRDEIAIMKLVGATDGFVRVPFVIEGLAQGFLASVLALVLLWLTGQALMSTLALALPAGLLSP